MKIKSKVGIETHKASPNMKKFFNKLAGLKKKIKDRSEETGDEFLKEIFEEFQNIYKPETIDFIEE